MMTVMTTKLNAIRQTQPLSKTTRAFDDCELEVLLNEINRDCQPEPRGTRLLSLEGDDGFSGNIAPTFVTNRSHN
ncbi:MAG TPA: hypothetical protein PLD20_09550 [Blastocatellia bacterium]|nr:hypothetical protein [Blastocatellia bacterium]HMX25343.1 hypothetical protein [Blastocatellia bacterium]HMY71023.1 hypothetical protein [Blastocatellia bacterium]HMZ18163.1 hypothetical protein [Blastocatellia bacterium]HNG33152.1 hypothetical protein [Blastocatellia bacterium]